NIMWQQCLGGTNYEYAYSVHQTSDNGFIICGKSDSDDGDVSGHHGGGDFWVVKLSPSTEITEATKPEILEISVFPNPFNSSVQITYSLPYRTEVNLAVFDIVGRMLVSLINEQKEAGTYSMNWTPGADVPSGLYLLVLKAANKTVAKQVLFMK
ncbi:MAG: T9SS type A sorting domain-containing protein, partial [candidate division WOR-3 bacterium]